MRNAMPRCPQCNHPGRPHYIRNGKTLEKIGIWCNSCCKPVDPIIRSDPVAFSMDIRDFLNSHKKKYDLILADPPWLYQHGTTTKTRLVENHYDTMPTGEIMELPINRIAKDKSILFLWTTSPKNEEGLDVMKAWGFTYRTQIVWEKYSNGKLQIGLGQNVRGTHELLLIGKRGEFATPRYKPPSTIAARRTEHSAKPIKFYEILEFMYPAASRIELFARHTRPGWVSVGNQLNQTFQSIILQDGTGALTGRSE